MKWKDVMTVLVRPATAAYLGGTCVYANEQAPIQGHKT